MPFLNLIDPRAKLLIAFLFSIITALSYNTLVLNACFLTGTLLWFCGSRDWRKLAARLLAVNIFMAMAWLTLPWQLHNGSFIYNSDGLYLALSITIKANAILLAWLGLLASSPVTDILHALAHWHLPNKLLALFFLFDRYVHLLQDEYHRLRTTMLVRGFKAHFNMHTFKTIAYLVGTVLLRGVDRAQKVHQAMLCRGFKGTFYLLSHFRWHTRDSYFLIGSLIWLAVLAGWEIFYEHY